MTRPSRLPSPFHPSPFPLSVLTLPSFRRPLGAEIVHARAAMDNEQAKNTFDIQGFPSLKLFKHGKHVADYPVRPHARNVAFLCDRRASGNSETIRYNWSFLAHF